MLTPGQVAGWARYYEAEPWGGQVDDLRHGILCATVANAAGAKVRPQRFMLRAPEEEASVESAARALGIPLPKPGETITGGE